MAADLYIHVLEGCTEEDLRIFSHRVLGSKHFDPWGNPSYDPDNRPEFEPAYPGERDTDQNLAWNRVSRTPSVHVGEVSWLSAMIAGDEENFVPNCVSHVQRVIGEKLPVLDQKLRDQILVGFLLPNQTSYALNSMSTVRAFLDAHLGKQLFCISW
jgi:hypothetical protein